MHKECPPSLHGKEKNRNRGCANCQRLHVRDQQRGARSVEFPSHDFVGSLHCKACNNEYQRMKHRRLRSRAAEIIARESGDSLPRCRADTLPDSHPLKLVPCYGKLQIDHINGGGSKELQKGSDRFIRGIANGIRSASDLRLLCLLHQLWNRT